MKARLGALSPRAKVGLAVAAVLVYALAVWFLVLGPKRSEAASLAADVAAAETQVAASKAAPATKGAAATPAADVVRLAKAMPSTSDQAGLVLELSRLGRGANVSVVSISLEQPATDAAGATVVPVSIVVSGTYRQVTRFLRSTRMLVSFHDGRLDARGRLFSVKGVELAESATKKFPFLDATVSLDAYAYDGPLPPATPPPPPASGETTSSGATAAGSVP